MAKIGTLRYIASNKPKELLAVIKQAGVTGKPNDTEDLINTANEIIKRDGVKAKMAIMEIHPDKAAILKHEAAKQKILKGKKAPKNEDKPIPKTANDNIDKAKNYFQDNMKSILIGAGSVLAIMLIAKSVK